MSSINSLPQEILRDIITRLSNVSDLWTCNLVSKRFAEVATPALYQDVDLRADERGDEDLHEESVERQRGLMRSIAEFPQLGAMVQSFKNHLAGTWGSFQDATQEQAPDVAMLMKAAANMKNLSSVFLTPGPVAEYIIGHLPDYSTLSNLTIEGLYPETHVWPIHPTQITTLKWRIPGNSHMNSWDRVTLIEKVVQLTCPQLDSLDVSVNGHDPAGASLDLGDRAKEYLSLNATTVPKLRNFAFSNKSYGSGSLDEVNELRTNHLDFVERYRDTLRSVTIPIPQVWDTDTLQFILNLCNLVPGINSISFAPFSIVGQGNLTAIEFWTRLTTALASPKFEIERLTVPDIGMCYSEDVGTLLAQWASLKYLRIGDANNNEGPFGDDGRLQFDEYKAELVKFFSALPKSIEELYLEINGDDLCVDEDEDFDPMQGLAPHLFQDLPRLHTCDFHAWISNLDGGLGALPEKAVLYRRLPGRDHRHKSVLIVRMDSVYQENNMNVRSHKEVFEGDFEGRDAEDTLGEWIQEYRLGDAEGSLGGGEEDERNEKDYRWPFSRDTVSRYPMFRRND